MKIKDCMSSEVCYTNPNTTVYEVTKMMNKNKIGSIPVCNTNNEVCGIVTDRDIILRCISCDKDPKTTKINEVMSKEVCTCNENEEITSAEKTMSEQQIRRIPVCDEKNKIVGMLSFSDVAKQAGNIPDNEVILTMKNIYCSCDDKENAE